MTDSEIRLHPMSRAAADAIAAGRRPDGVEVAADYPTEFSAGVAEYVGADGQVGPYFVLRTGDDVVVGEIGGAVVAPGTVEIGYAIVESAWGRGYATAAVAAFAERARELPDVRGLIAHTPLDRPASGRVVAKAGFALAGEEADEHEGVTVRVQRWTLDLAQPHD